jgi:hypothetical protein
MDLKEKLARVDEIMAEVTTTANVAPFVKGFVDTDTVDDAEEKDKEKDDVVN